MTPIHLLTKTICLAFQEALQYGSTGVSAELIDKVYESVKPTDTSSAIADATRDRVVALSETLLWIKNTKDPEELNDSTLLRRIRIDALGDSDIYEAIERSVTTGSEQDRIKAITSERLSIKRYFREKSVTEKILAVAKDIRFNQEKIDVAKLWKSLSTEVDQLIGNTSEKDPAIVNDVSSENMVSLVDACAEVMDDESSVNGVRFGLQGFNRAIGGCLKAGRNMMLTALQHNYKTSMVNSLFADACQLNTFVCKDPNKKPAVVLFIFEDILSDSLRFIYTYIYANENNGAQPDLSKITQAEMAGYLAEKLNQTGVVFRIIKVNASNWNYKDVIAKMDSVEAEGLEIMCAIFDYIAIIPTTGLPDNPSGYAIQLMWRYIRLHCAAKKIPSISPHQLNTTARNTKLEGGYNFVRKVGGNGMLAGNNGLEREPDVTIDQHLEEYSDGHTYYTAFVSKLRGPTIPKAHKYFVYRMPESGPLLRDIHTQSRCLAKVGGNALDDIEPRQSALDDIF